MNLQLPPEPINQRIEWKKELEKGGRMNLARYTIKQGTWITSPLWSEYKWKEKLKKNGISWQKFMELYRNCYHNFISWVEDHCSWDNAIKSLVREIEREIERAPPRE